MKTQNRLQAAVGAGAFIVALAACGGGSGGASSPLPATITSAVVATPPLPVAIVQPTPAPASTPPPQINVVSLGDSIAAGAGAAQINGVPQSFSLLAAAALGASSFTSLAVPSTTCAYATSTEVPQIPLGANLVIIDCGTNDVDQQVANATDFPALLAAIQARLPAAKIVIVDIYTVTAANPNSTITAVTAWDAMEKADAAAVGATVVDIQNNASIAANLADGVHPNPTGNDDIAALVVKAVATFW